MTFDGTGISIWDLKREIILQNKMGKGTDFDLAVYDADTEEGTCRCSRRIQRRQLQRAALVPCAGPAPPSVTAGAWHCAAVCVRRTAVVGRRRTGPKCAAACGRGAVPWPYDEALRRTRCRATSQHERARRACGGRRRRRGGADRRHVPSNHRAVGRDAGAHGSVRGRLTQRHLSRTEWYAASWAAAARRRTRRIRCARRRTPAAARGLHLLPVWSKGPLDPGLPYERQPGLRQPPAVQADDGYPQKHAPHRGTADRRADVGRDGDARRLVRDCHARL